MYVIAFNGSPRKKQNTATLLQSALDGAAAAGADTELIHLYGLDYKGCRSCYECKRTGGKSYGRCAVKDDLAPVFDKVEQADALIFGSPIYLGHATGQMLSFSERLLYQYLLYDKAHSSLFKRRLPCAFIYTMGVNEEQAAELGYDAILHRLESFFIRIFGELRTMRVYDTCHTDDYSFMDASAFDIEAKTRRKAEIFPLECGKAFELGRSLVS